MLNFLASPVMAYDLRLQFRESLVQNSNIYLLFSFVVHFIVSPFFIANIFWIPPPSMMKTGPMMHQVSFGSLVSVFVHFFFFDTN